ncbi:unnamed protein product, partial [Closterium sp. NIES-53]
LVLAHSSTVLPCPAAPSGLLSGLHLPSFSTNLVSGADLQDAWVFAASSRSSPASAPCSFRHLAHETVLWQHRLGHPSLPRLRGMASRALVSGLPRSLPPLPPGPAPTCVPCVESTPVRGLLPLPPWTPQVSVLVPSGMELLLRPSPLVPPRRFPDRARGLVLAHSSTVLPCPAAPSGLLSGLHLPSFSTNLVSGADLQDAWVDQFTPGGQRVTHCTCSPTGRHLATFTRRPGSSPCLLPRPGLVLRLPPVRFVIWRTRQSFGSTALVTPPCLVFEVWPPVLLSLDSPGPSLPFLRGLPPPVFLVSRAGSAPPLTPSLFPPTEAPLQTLHMDVWGPARVRGKGHERYFLLVVDDYSRYTTVFPLRSKSEVPEVLIDWIRGAGCQLSESFHSDLPTFTLPASPQKNRIAERRIGMVMDVARTSMIHAAAPHFLWPFAVHYAAHQINLQPRVSLPETTPTLRWMGKVGDASAFRVWGSRAFVRDTTADKLSSRAVPCVFLGFPPDAPGWQFYHPTSRHVLSSQDATFDESC